MNLCAMQRATVAANCVGQNRRGDPRFSLGMLSWCGDARRRSTIHEHSTIAKPAVVAEAPPLFAAIRRYRAIRSRQKAALAVTSNWLDPATLALRFLWTRSELVFSNSCLKKRMRAPVYRWPPISGHIFERS
jgi:hypothetical protein